MSGNCQARQEKRIGTVDERRNGKRFLTPFLSDREDWGVTIQVLQKFYVNAIRAPHQIGHDEAVAMIEEIASSRPVIGADIAQMRLALQIKRRYGIAYWDAAVLAGARRMGAAVLVSEDFSHGQDYGGVRVLNPFTAS